MDDALRYAVTLLSCEPKPALSFGGVLEDAASRVVHDTEVALRGGVPLIGSKTKPAHGFGGVLGNPDAGTV